MYHFNSAEKFSYLGEFWKPEEPDIKFSGRIEYSPNDGISVKFITSTSFSGEDVYPTLYGFCEEIEDITLINCIPNGGKIYLGSHSYKTKIYKVIGIIVGIHISKDEKIFDGICFHFPEMNSFCRWRNDDYFTSDHKPIVDCRTKDNLNIKITQGYRDTMDLSLVLNDATLEKICPHLIHYRKNIATNTEISPEEQKIIDKEQENITITKPFYITTIKGNKSNIGNYLQIRYKIEKLFSIFFLKPIYSTFSKIFIGNKEYTLIENVKSLKDNKNIEYFPYIPVNISNVKDKFNDIYDTWNNILPSDMLDVVIVDKFYNHAGSGYQQFSILLSIIGSWQIIHGSNKTYNSRYQKFLEENLPNNDILTDGSKIDDKIIRKGIKERFYEILGFGKTWCDIACDLDNIRDCILHLDMKINNKKSTNNIFDKYKNIIEKETSISNLCEILFIVLVKAIYSKLGIKLTDDEKNNLLRYVVSWTSYPN